MKQQYFRVPWSRLRFSARALARQAQKEDEEWLSHRLTKRSECRKTLRAITTDAHTVTASATSTA